jgi:hypothetical protein
MDRERHRHLWVGRMFWLSSKKGQGVNDLKPNQRAPVITLLERKSPKWQIARITGIDRKTIRSYR